MAHGQCCSSASRMPANRRGPAGLMRHITCDTVVVYSALTKPGTAINDLSAQVLQEVGRHHRPAP